MNKIAKTYFVFFVLLLTIVSLVLEFDLISSQAIRLKHLQILPENQKNHFFVFVIPSYNCADVTRKTLESIAHQTYKNLKVILIDDGSNDHTVAIAEDVKKEYKGLDLDIKRYPIRKGAIERLYEEVHQLDDDQIVVYLKGNSWLTDENALRDIHAYYQQYDIWFAYSRHINFRTAKIGGYNPWSAANATRRKSFGRPRLKTFYAGLFKKINLYDFYFEGSFITDHRGTAYTYPLMEMVGKHYAFIKRPLCTYLKKDVLDESRPSNISPELCNRKIASSKPYPPLSTRPFVKTPIELTETSIIVFSCNRPLQLFATLESLKRHVQSPGTLSVIYKAEEPSFLASYEELKKTFPDVDFIRESKEKPFYPLFKRLVKESPHYILLTSDDIVVKDRCDLKACMQKMNTTSADFFSLIQGKNLTSLPKSHVSISEDMISFSEMAPHIRPFSMILYPKSTLLNFLNDTTVKNPLHFDKLWHKKKMMHGKIGLAFSFSKAIGIPLGLMSNKRIHFYSAQELLTKFEEGLKMNIDPLFQLKNTSDTVDHQPLFVNRKTLISDSRKARSDESLSRVD